MICYRCNQPLISTKEAFLAHVKIHHPLESLYHCIFQDCSNRFTSRVALHKHVKKCFFSETDFNNQIKIRCCNTSSGSVTISNRSADESSGNLQRAQENLNSIPYDKMS